MDSPQIVKAEHVTAVYRLLDSIFRDTPDANTQQVRTDFPLFFAANNLRNRRVIIHKEQIICHAGFWPRSLKLATVTLKTAVVVLVATHPDHRRRGLAARCMQSLQQQLRTEHYDLGILWTGVPQFYEPLGWKTAVPPGSYLNRLTTSMPGLKHQMANVPPFELRAYSEAHHLRDIMTLQRRQPIRLLRSPSDFRQLLALPRIQVWVVQRKRVDAYIVVGSAVNKRGILEYGGQADDILAGIGKLVQEQHLDQSVSMPIFGAQSEIAALFEAHQIPMTSLNSSKGQGSEMRLLLNRQRANDLVENDIFVWGLDWA